MLRNTRKKIRNTFYVSLIFCLLPICFTILLETSREVIKFPFLGTFFWYCWSITIYLNKSEVFPPNVFKWGIKDHIKFNTQGFVLSKLTVLGVLTVKNLTYDFKHYKFLTILTLFTSSFPLFFAIFIFEDFLNKLLKNPRLFKSLIRKGMKKLKN